VYCCVQWIGSLKPLVFIMVGIDLDINDLSFLTRLYNVLVHQLPLFLSNEALARHRTGPSTAPVRGPLHLARHHQHHRVRGRGEGHVRARPCTSEPREPPLHQ